MDMYDLIMKRRSVRNFTDEKISEHIIEKLCDAANNAPSGGNIQPVSIILVQEDERKKKLAAMVEDQPWVYNAPLSMIFCLDFHRVKKWSLQFETEFLVSSRYFKTALGLQNEISPVSGYCSGECLRGKCAYYCGSQQLFPHVRRTDHCLPLVC